MAINLFGKDKKRNKKAKDSKGSNHNRVKNDRKNVLTSKSGFFLREAYKTLRTNVNFALADKDGCKVVLVTSSLQSEGKTLTATNLAISLGQTGAKVIMIDCDLRRPKLGKLLNISSKSGLSNLLVAPASIDNVILKDDHGIDVIVAGDIPPNPSELLASTRMQNLISQLKERYDYVIIDTPPVDMVVDAVVLAPHCDGVLFVVKAGQSERGAVIHAMEQLTYAKANVLGFAFNGVTSESGSGYGKYRYTQYGRYSKYYRYGKYGRYGYGYGYGYGRSSSSSSN